MALAASVAILGTALSVTGGAVADTMPANRADPRTPETVSTDVLPAPQIGDGLSAGLGDTKGSGVVWDQLVVGDTVYVVGDFQFARPAGAKPGEQVVARKNFLAYDLKTGALLDYAPSFDAQARSLAASPDGKRLYVGGLFSAVWESGSAAKQTRYRLAAFDLPAGTLAKGFAPGMNARVNTIAATNSTVYVGGAFTSAQQAARGGLAAFNAVDGALTPWAPVATDGPPLALVLSPDQTKIVVAGSFTSLNGSTNPGYGMGAVSATDTGTTSLPWKVNATIRNAGSHNRIMSLASDGASVYGTASQGAAATGAIEGTFKASWADGTLEWLADCHGDTYSAAARDGAVYTTGHAHDCEGVGAFPNVFRGTPGDWTNIEHHRALAFTVATTGTLKPWSKRETYGSFEGKPAPSLLDWYPDLTPGTFTGTTQAAWDVTASGDYVLYAGEFPAVNGVKQQGLVRFPSKQIAPNKDKPVLEGSALTPTVSNLGGSHAKVTWTANWDRDNANLTHQVIRDGNTAKPVFETTMPSRFWDRPILTAVDGPLSPGKHTYQIRTVDPFGNARWGGTVEYTAAASASPWPDGAMTAYDTMVMKDVPTSYWPMNEQAGDTAYDFGRSADDQKPVTQPRAAGIEAAGIGRAAEFAGTPSSFARSATVAAAPTVYSSELWFKTTTTKGGKLLGFGTPEGAADRHVYMSDDGRLTYGVYVGGFVPVTTSKSYNDGTWHHVVASLGPDGMKLSVDGNLATANAAVTQAYTYPSGGSWYIGGHVQGGWPNRGTSDYFQGAIDNVAVYGRVLSAAEVASHFTAGSTQPNTAPTSSFTASVADRVLSVDGSTSTDSDGRVATYAWDFGDGSTGSGATTSHTFAEAGAYTVRLTVTDDEGSTATSSKAVTVPATPQPEPGVTARDAFTRSVGSGWGSADTGGVWTSTGHSGGISAGAGVFVSGGGQTRGMDLRSVSSASSDSRVSFRIDQSPAAAAQYVSVVGRQVGAESYSARAIVQTNGVLQLQVRRNGTELKTVNVPAAVYTVGQPVHVRLQVTGTGTTTVNAKVWTTGDEPAAWTASATDSAAALQSAGSVGLGFYLGGKGSETRVSFSDYSVETVR